MTEETEWKPDIITVDKWECPTENDARILTQPNVPFPIQGEFCQPRTIFSQKVWNQMRKYCYEQADYTCEVCGYKPDRDNKEYVHAHELFTYDYTTQTAKFERCVCLCPKTHIMSIHTGRALTLYEKGDPMYTKSKLLDGAEHAFSIIHSWNEEHPDEEPLRLFYTWVDYWKNKELHDDMEALIKKYDIKFYKVSNKWFTKKRWPNWKVIIGGVEHYTPYANAHEWESKMEETNKSKVIEDNMKGEVYNELNAIINAMKEDNGEK